MSKCKPSMSDMASAKGIQIEDRPAEHGKERTVVVKIPYDRLLQDASISDMRLADIVKISVPEGTN